MTAFLDQIVKWAPIVTVILIPLLGWGGRQMLKQIHVLVNDRLDKALSRIEALEGQIRELKEE